ncbi:WG repeat-containing protein [Rhizobium bangladeshense]|uniref:WG repeat-containing protein n=1 Tax=Rhizobium bangladeshense TaxID=1138189 RepID=UPI001C8364AB|nr:WG repeat-containing protein [Rhizobium bangladeshense]MBX4913980.1 WG repeat-containing protein [Rhizobium bangladeshense]
MPRFWANRTWSWKWVRIPLLVISLSCTPSQGFGTADVVASGRAMVPSCGGIFDLCGYSDRQSGKELIPKLFERAILFSEGLAAVRMNGLFGYIDTTGKVVIEPRFDLAGPFHDGFAEILVGQQTGVVSESGEVVLEPQFGRSTPIMGDVLIVRKGHFRPKRPPELEELESFDGLYTEYGPMGLYSLRKGWLTEETYEFRRFERGRPGYVWARDLRAKQSRFGLMNNEGEWKVEPMFDTVQPLFDGRAVVSVKVKDTETRRQLWGAVDADGKLAIPIAYDWLSYWDQGYSVARLNGEEGFLDTGGSLLGGRFFEKVERDLQGKPLKVQLDGKWFGITADGRLVDVPEVVNCLLLPKIPSARAVFRSYRRTVIGGCAAPTSACLSTLSSKRSRVFAAGSPGCQTRRRMPGAQSAQMAKVAVSPIAARLTTSTSCPITIRRNSTLTRSEAASSGCGPT